MDSRAFRLLEKHVTPKVWSMVRDKPNMSARQVFDVLTSTCLRGTTRSISQLETEMEMHRMGESESISDHFATMCRFFRELHQMDQELDDRREGREGVLQDEQQYLTERGAPRTVTYCCSSCSTPSRPSLRSSSSWSIWCNSLKKRHIVAKWSEIDSDSPILCISISVSSWDIERVVPRRHVERQYIEHLSRRHVWFVTNHWPNLWGDMLLQQSEALLNPWLSISQ
jgi:hypothetical protein